MLVCHSSISCISHDIPLEGITAALLLGARDHGLRQLVGLHGVHQNGPLPGRCSLGMKPLKLPSGKHTKSYGKSPCLMGNSTISMAIFNSYVK